MVWPDVDPLHLFLVGTCLLNAGIFDLLADNSSEFKFPSGFWTKADTADDKHTPRTGIRKWIPWFDGWHLLKGRTVDFACLACAFAALPFSVWAFPLAVCFRCIFSAGNTVFRTK